MYNSYPDCYLFISNSHKRIFNSTLIVNGSLRETLLQRLMNSVTLAIPSRFISWNDTFSDISRKCILSDMIRAVPALIISGKMHFLLISVNEVFHEIKCDGITSFLDFMCCTSWPHVCKVYGNLKVKFGSVQKSDFIPCGDAKIKIPGTHKLGWNCFELLLI